MPPVPRVTRIIPRCPKVRPLLAETGLGRRAMPRRSLRRCEMISVRRGRCSRAAADSGVARLGASHERLEADREIPSETGSGADFDTAADECNHHRDVRHEDRDDDPSGGRRPSDRHESRHRHRRGRSRHHPCRHTLRSRNLPPEPQLLSSNCKAPIRSALKIILAMGFMTGWRGWRYLHTRPRPMVPPVGSEMIANPPASVGGSAGWQG